MNKLAFLFAAVVTLLGASAFAETIPPKPDRYFNDYAHVVSPEAAARFNEQLAQFERETSDQIVVAVFAKMDSDSSIDDFTQRTFHAWGVGQKDKRNGAVLFVFKDDRKMFIQVGYGLEGALPDLTAYDITERHIKPKFRANDYEGGLATGIDLICKAVRGEYTGTGATVKEGEKKASGGGSSALFLIIFLIILMLALRRRRSSGYGYSSFGGPFLGGWSSGGGGWSGGSSNGGGGGFSGFSGGGGDSGGGGAGSSW